MMLIINKFLVTLGMRPNMLVPIVGVFLVCKYSKFPRDTKLWILFVEISSLALALICSTVRPSYSDNTLKALLLGGVECRRNQRHSGEGSRRRASQSKMVR